MVALASAFVRLRPDPNRSEFVREGKKMGEEAGTSAGKAFGDGFYRDANGKLRQANGRFATDAQKRMFEGGQGAGGQFTKGFEKGSSGLVASLKSNLKLAAGVFVPLGLAAAVGEIGKIGMAYEDNLNIFKVVSQATGAQMAAVADKARQLGADVQLPGVSAAGAAAAMTELAKASFTVQESMDAARGTLQLARIASISEAEAAEIAANAVNAFGIKASDTGKVVDQLAAAANSSSIEVTEASFSFKQAAAAFSGLLGPAVGSEEAITELNTAIAILGNNGIKGSDAGTSLKQMLLQLTAPSEQAKGIMRELAAEAAGANISLEMQSDILHGGKKVREEAINQLYKMNPQLENMGDIAYDANGKMRPLRDIIDLVARGTANMTQEERNYAITQVFGADATRSVLALLKGGLPVYDAMRQAILKQGSAAEVAAAKNAGLRGAIDNVKSQVENASIAVYNVVKGPLTTGLNALANALPGIFARIGQFATFIIDNIGVIRDWALAIGAVTLAIKLNSAMLAVQAAGGLLAYIKTVRLVTTTTRIWAAAQAVLNASLFANPIGLVIIAITALVAAVVLAWRNSETFRNIVTAAWNGIKVAIGAVVSWITGTVWPSLKRAWDQIAAAAMWLWHNVIQPAWNGIKAVIDFVVNAVKLYIKALIWEFNLIADAAMWLWRNIFSPVFNGIRKIVEIWWLAVQIVFKAVANVIEWVVGKAIEKLRAVWDAVFTFVRLVVQRWWADVQRLFGLFRTYVLGPLQAALTTARDFFARIFGAISNTVRTWWQGNISPIFTRVREAWNTLSGAFSSVYNNQIRPLFQRFTDFIRNTVVKGFTQATDMIRSAWDKVREYARKPVAFVVNSVINPFIRGLNKVAGLVGVKDRVSEIGGFARGGQIPGAPSRKDNRLAIGPAGMLKVASGEWINRTASTMRNLPLLKRVNSLSRTATMADLVDVVPDGRAKGGPVGDGIGDFFGKLYRGAKGLGEAVLNPKEAATKIANAALARIPGSGMLVDFLRGSAKKLIGSVGSWLGDKLGGFGIGNSGVAGGWKGMQRLISARFPGLNLISGLRVGARTLSGNRSYHSMGRAVDYPAVRALAAWIKSTFGAKTKELITPWQDLNLLNGKPHAYTGAVWRQHNFAGGNAHVHWAAELGGLVGKLTGMPVRLLDSGGPWPSGTLGVNASGHTEHVLTGGPSGDVAELKEALYGILEAIRGLGGDVAEALERPTRRATQLGRGRGIPTRAGVVL